MSAPERPQPGAPAGTSPEVDATPGARAPETPREPEPARDASGFSDSKPPRPVPPEVEPFVRSTAWRIRVALDAAHGSAELAAVLIHADRDRLELPSALGDVGPGHQALALPRARVRALAQLVAPKVAHRLDEKLEPGWTWVLVIGPTGAGVSALRFVSHDH